MALYKRGKYWLYDFIQRGVRHQGSTRQTNINKARLVEAKLKSDLALQQFGIAPAKLAPMFKEFMEKRFLDHCWRTAKAKRTGMFYKYKTVQLLRFEGWKNLRLSEIDEDHISKYCDYRLKTVAVDALNAELRALRKALNLAHEWQLIQRKPKVRTLPGEKPRSFVVSGELEKEYLSVAQYPLREAAILILDCGLRPEECVSLRKENISVEALSICAGKTQNATRTIPHTQRTSTAAALLCALFPDSPWLFPSRKGSHLTRGALDNMHAALRRSHGWPTEFVLYSLRHTFATRLAESGANNFEIMSLMGHADIRMSSKYIHPGSDTLSRAMKRKEMLDRAIRGEVQTHTPQTPSHSSEK